MSVVTANERTAVDNLGPIQQFLSVLSFSGARRAAAPHVPLPELFGRTRKNCIITLF